jgi:hypothetical protein
MRYYFQVERKATTGERWCYAWPDREVELTVGADEAEFEQLLAADGVHAVDPHAAALSSEDGVDRLAHFFTAGV